MKRHFMFAAMFVGAISGCVSTDNNAPETGGVKPHYGRSFGPPTVPGLEGPYGTKVPMAAPYNMAPPSSQYAALNMMNQNIPMNYVQQNPMMGGGPGGMPNPMAPGGMLLSPPGVPAMPGMPGGMPGMPGGMPPMPGAGPGNPLMKTSMQGMMPDAGMMNANMPPGAAGAKQSFAPGQGVTPAQFATTPPVGSMFPAQRTQVQFGNPVRMKVYWYTQGPDGKPNYSTTPLETPGRYNFAQGAIYRLKLTNIPGRPALELYPTLEVVPTGPKTNEFLAHNSVPLDFSEEDFKQVVDRNYIVKVIYLPDPQFQDAAGAGPGEITSTQLEPGQDPIQEALRRGSILLVLRIGNIDQGLISSPPTNAPIPSGPPMMFKPPFMGVPPGMQIPMNLPPITPGAPGGFVPLPPGAIPPGAIPPGAIPPVGIPPGGLGQSPLPPLGPGGVNPNPPLFNVPDLPAPGAGSVLNPHKIDGIKPPPPPLPAPPLPTPGGAKSNDLPTLPPVVPASKQSTTPANAPNTLPAPTLPALDPAGASRPSLPAIPLLPEAPTRK